MSKVPYFDETLLDDGSVISCDMVRLRIKFYDPDALASFGQALNDSLDFDDVKYTEKIWERYRHMWVIRIGDASFAVGAHFQSGNRVVPTAGFVEFNPNKVNWNTLTADGKRKPFRKFWELLQNSCRKCELVRWDLAQDFPIARNLLGFRKGGATYQYHAWATVTEYHGTHNSPGFCKLYDKAAEVGLSGSITRCEMTCAGEWTAEEIQEHRPKWVGKDLSGGVDLEQVKGQTRALVMMAIRLQELEVPIEGFLMELDSRKRKEVEALLRGSPPELYPLDAVRSLLCRVKERWTFGTISFEDDSTGTYENASWRKLMGLDAGVEE